MARPPLLTLTNVQLTFGGRPLFSGVEFPLSKGERCALVGRNGAGKSTLMKLVAGMIEPDGGEIWTQPGSVAAFVAQEPDFSPYDTLVDFVADGLDDRFRAEAELTEMGLDPQADPAKLSGGQLRKAAIARGFAHDPDILLMDEPTNHLDIATIQQLETRLNGFNGAALIVSHDRAFLETVSTNTLWLRQGKVWKSPRSSCSLASRPLLRLRRAVTPRASQCCSSFSCVFIRCSCFSSSASTPAAQSSK